MTRVVNAFGGRMLHGTDPALIEKIKADGLQPSPGEYPGEPEGVFMTPDPMFARGMSALRSGLSRAQVKRLALNDELDDWDLGVLVIDTADLPLLRVRTYGGSYVSTQPIESSRILGTIRDLSVIAD